MILNGKTLDAPIVRAHAVPSDLTDILSAECAYRYASVVKILYGLAVELQLGKRVKIFTLVLKNRLKVLAYPFCLTSAVFKQQLKKRS